MSRWCSNKPESLNATWTRRLIASAEKWAAISGQGKPGKTSSPKIWSLFVLPKYCTNVSCTPSYRWTKSIFSSLTRPTIPRRTTLMPGESSISFCGNVRILILCRIIRDFYIPLEDSAKRPKVFGMTASPVDARVDVVKAAK